MLLVSRCLAGENCRYDGSHNLSEKVADLMTSRPYVLACPEVMAGLSTPRTPCEIIGQKVISQLGEDRTSAFIEGAKMTLELCHSNHVTTALLKAKSPSCGVGLIYDGSFSKQLVQGNGVTAQMLIDGGVRVIDETMAIGQKILVAYEVTDAQRKRIISHFPEHDFKFILSKDATQADLQEADIIWGNPRSGQLKNCPNLKWLQLESAGFERYTVKDVLPKRVTLTNARGCYGPAVSEHMFAMTLMLLKKLHLYRDNQNEGLWKDMGQVKSLNGALVVIVGAGDIGRHYSQAVRKMGAKTIGIKRTPPSEGLSKNLTEFNVPVWGDSENDFDAISTISHFKSLAAKANVIALCAPDNEESRTLINEETLDILKDDVILINGGRGSAIDQDAVVKAINGGKCISLGLDVTSPEPLLADHPLWHMPNVFISPHISGGNHLPETFERLVDLSIRNLEAFTRQTTLENVIILGETVHETQTTR